MGRPQLATPPRKVRWWTVPGDDGQETLWVKITVGSRSSCYWIGRLPTHPAAFRLHKEEGGHYDVTYDCHVGSFGAECTCADWTFRHANDGRSCKHIDALRALKLFPEIPSTDLDPSSHGR